MFTAKYLPLFNAKYPGVKVKFEALTDYEGETKTRMNTTEYGDVLLIPNAITPDKLAEFFEPLGTLDELSQKYNFTTEQLSNGKVYGLAVTGNANGFVYNKKVWDAAGVTSLPKTPDEFLADLKLIKDKESSVTPYYTNYKDGWPLTQWQSNRGQITNDPNYANGTLVHADAPWAAGTDENVIYSLLYNIVKQGLSEKDPTTTAWEPSKALLGGGKVATMQLGSWAIVQMQEAAVKAGGSADDIHYLPFPNQVGGKFISNIGGDYKIGINVHSQNKEAARAWIDWFENESNFAFDQGGVSPVKGGKNPPQLSDFDGVGVAYIEQAPAAAGEEGLLGKIQDQSEIQLFDQAWPQRIVDAARGATNEGLDAIFADLNGKWKAARATLSIK
ncbi:MAG TPA: extracellular solute-binding protein [Candidatus Limnocylindrales bacterium]|nr:extracellular solute-binding protein [Candidatus Limnocylindrales bacterium]